MLKEILSFELKNRLKQPMVYVFTIINFILMFAASVSDNVQIGGGNDAININAPHVIMTTTLLMTLIGVFMTTAFVNSAMLRDFDHKFDGMIFSTSITRNGYLGGRFLGAFLVSLIPFLGVFGGVAFAAMSPWVGAEDVSAFSMGIYVSTFVTAVVPNVFLISSIVFMLAALFRSSLYSFIGAIGIVILYLLMSSVSGSMDNETIAILSDPLGISSYDLLTKYWTIDEKNSQIYGLTGMLLINRLIWISLAFGVLLFTFKRFSFAQRSKKVKKGTRQQEQVSPIAIYQQLAALPKVKISDSLSNNWSQFSHQAWMEIRSIIRSTPFIVIMAFSVINMFGGLSAIDQSYGTGNHPVTYLMVDGIRGSLYVFLIAVLMYYAGVLVWKERDAKMDEFFDTSPFPSWIPYLAKFTALVGIAMVTLLLGMLCGMIMQAIGGYTNFEIGVYLRELLVFDLLQFTTMIALAMLIQTLVNNKYIGYFAFLITIIAFKFGPSALEISSNLLAYGNVPSHIYSDMNGWSLYSAGLFWFNAYWALFASLLTVLGITFWIRGRESQMGKRIKIAKGRFNGKLAMSAVVLGIAWMTTTGFLFYQTQVLNTTKSADQSTMERVDYERTYKKHQHIAQPRITAVDYKIDIYPEDRNFSALANMTLLNKTDEVIDEVHFSLSDEYEIDIKIPNSKLTTDDKELGYRIFKLAQPMPPKEERQIEITTSYTTHGIENEVSNSDIVSNGTFLSNFKFVPVIGYSERGEVSSKKDREKYNLGTKLNKAKLHDGCSKSCQNTYISQDADWVYVTSTISTSSDQIAIAPGTLVKEWKDGDRKYFSYQLEEKVLNFYSFISGKYEIAKDEWTSTDGQKVDVEVYYHKGHDYNVDKMIKSVKNSLTYYTDNFTSYPHKQARIIEFPRYASFAQAFPGTMPYSESMGFISNLQEENAIDHVYYVVAHEMAHQWWAHQVIGANVQGSTMLSESFAQYSALMVMKKEYGSDKMKQFMQYEMDRYLRGRARESEKELPLMINEDQSYIHYAKGSVVMYALQEYIGEEKINQAMREFAIDKSYQEPPYTNTLDFKAYLYEVTPDSLQYLIKDMVESITLYSNRTTDASYTKMSDGKYEVTIDVTVEKYSADSLGSETLIGHDDFIDIGVFSKDIPKGEKYGRPILIQRVKIDSPTSTFTMVVDEEPYQAGIDPNYLLVDRMPEDNVKVLDER